MSARTVHIPPGWNALRLDDLSGVILVLGAPDTGKSTFARYLFDRLSGLGRKVAFIDGDPGQSALGPPTTLTLTFEPDLLDGLQAGNVQPTPSMPPSWRYFVGSNTPQGHMLPTVVGAVRLAQTAQTAGAEVVVYDTSGLVEPSRGGLALKNAKMDLLQPGAVFAIQREAELEPLLIPLRRSHRTRLVEQRLAPGVISRDAQDRRQHRARRFASYFAQAKILDLEWSRMAVFPYPDFRMHRLASLEDLQGLSLAVGIVVSIDRTARRAGLLTPLSSLASVNAIRLGDVQVNPDTFQDEQIMN